MGRCPDCHDILFIIGNPGDIVRVSYRNYGLEGKVILPNITVLKRFPFKLICR